MIAYMVAAQANAALISAEAGLPARKKLSAALMERFGWGVGSAGRTKASKRRVSWLGAGVHRVVATDRVNSWRTVQDEAGAEDWQLSQDRRFAHAVSGGASL